MSVGFASYTMVQDMKFKGLTGYQVRRFMVDSLYVMSWSDFTPGYDIKLLNRKICNNLQSLIDNVY